MLSEWEKHHFHWADYVVFSLALLISAAIGVYYGFTGKRQTTTKEFLLGGRKLKALPVALSLHASFMSAIFVLGTPAEVYLHGSMYCWVGLGYLVAAPLTAHVFVPLFHRRQATSAHEFLEKRFNKHVRSLGSMTFVSMMVLYMAVVLYTPALAFSQVTGFPMWMSVIGIGLVCTFYTALGGMKAVVWTDAFQMIVILAGLLTLLIQGTHTAGGWQKVFNLAWNESRIEEVNFSLHPYARHTVWTQLIGGAVMTLTLYGSNQAMIQRYLSIEKLHNAQAAAYMAMGSSSVYLVLVTLLGFTLFGYYHGCDPLTTGQVTKADQLIPLMVMDVLGRFPGLPGLFTACTFSAALSTVSSGVNSLAAVLLEDIIKPIHFAIKHREFGERTATHISKVLAVLLGILTIGLGMLASVLGTLVLQITLSIFGMLGGPLLGLFCLGIFFPCANSWGAVFGLLSSLIFSFWLTIGALVSPHPSYRLPLTTDKCDSLNLTTSNITIPLLSSSTPSSEYTESQDMTSLAPLLHTDSIHKWSIYDISYMWYSPLTVGVVLFVGILVSLVVNRCQMTRWFQAECLFPSLGDVSSHGCCQYQLVLSERDSAVSVGEEEPLDDGNGAKRNNHINGFHLQSVKSSKI